MKNYVQPGNVLELTAPSGGVVSGTAYVIGRLFGVAVVSAAEGKKFAFSRTGVFTLPKTTGQDWTEGETLYWDAGNDKLTDVPGDHLRVGAAIEVTGTNDTEGKVLLIPDLLLAPVSAITIPAAITGGESPTEAEHNALRAAVASLAAALTGQNIVAD